MNLRQADTLTKPTHSWWRPISIAYVPGPITPLMDTVAKNLLTYLRETGHHVLEQPGPGDPPRLRDLLGFTLPLTGGGYFLSLATVVLAGIMARAPDPERMIPVYYLALGLASPVAFGATRMQTIVLAFPPADRFQGQTLRFAIAAGCILGLLPLVFILPGLDRLYYVQLQNLDPADLQWVRQTAAVLTLLPLAVALRAHSEGLATWLKNPSIVLLGHAVFLIIAAAAGTAALGLGMTGCLIGAASLPLGSLASSATMRLALKRHRA